MKVIKKKIRVLGVKNDSKWQRIDINLGSVVFHLSQGQIMIDETPYTDEHLVPIKNIVVNEKYFSFDSFYKNQDTHFEIHYSSFNVAINIATYIKYINENGAIFNNEYDSIDFIYNEDEYYICLENELKGKRIVVCYNKYRNYFTLVYPKPGKEFLIDKCVYENKTVYVKCKGYNLWDENDLTSDYMYQWEINFDSNFINIIDVLLLFGFDKISNPNNKHLSDNKKR